MSSDVNRGDTPKLSHVWLRPAHAGQTVLTLGEFLDHPPEQRANWILEEVCAFLTPAGTQVPLCEALAQLRSSWGLRAGFLHPEQSTRVTVMPKAA